MSHKSKKLRVPNKLGPKRLTLIYIIIKMTRLNDEKRILTAAREKKVVT